MPSSIACTTAARHWSYGESWHRKVSASEARLLVCRGVRLPNACHCRSRIWSRARVRGPPLHHRARGRRRAGIHRGGLCSWLAPFRPAFCSGGSTFSTGCMVPPSALWRELLKIHTLRSSVCPITPVRRAYPRRGHKTSERYYRFLTYDAPRCPPVPTYDRTTLWRMGESSGAL